MLTWLQSQNPLPVGSKCIWGFPPKNPAMFSPLSLGPYFAGQAHSVNFGCRSRCVAKPDIWFFGDFASTLSAFYKGESQEKKVPGDWKEQRFLPSSPAH